MCIYNDYFCHLQKLLVKIEYWARRNFFDFADSYILIHPVIADLLVYVTTHDPGSFHNC